MPWPILTASQLLGTVLLAEELRTWLKHGWGVGQKWVRTPKPNGLSDVFSLNP